MARRCRHVRAGGVRLGDRLLRSTGLSPCGAGGASLVGGVGLVGRDVALPGRRRRRCQFAGALSAVRLAHGDQERRRRPGAGRAGLGDGARAVAAAAGHAAERRRLVAMGAAAVNAIIAPWFVHKRPAALAMAYNGASIGGVVFSPLWVFAIASVGFPMAAAVIGAVMIVLVWLLADLVFSRTPQSTGQSPDGEPAGAPPVANQSTAQALPGRLLWRDRTFLTLAAAMAFGLFAQIGLLAHLFSLLVPPLGEQAAGILMGLATASAIAGRTLVGWLMPAGSDRRLIACASLVVQIAGSVILMITGVLLFGAGIGNTTSLPPLIAQVEFTRADVQRVVPLIVALGQATYAFA